MIFVLSVVGLLILISILVNITPVQNFLVHQVSNTLSKDLHTKVEVKHVDFKLFNRFVIEGTYVADQKGDTLLYAKKMSVNVTNFFFFKKRTVLYYVGIEDAKVNLIRAPGDSTWNYQFIVDAFTNPDKPKKKNGLPNLNLRKIDLKNVQLNKTDGWYGKDFHLSARHIEINAKNIALQKHLVQVKSIELNHPLFALEKYQETDTQDTTFQNEQPASQIDSGSLRWNTQHWNINVNNIHINKGKLELKERGHKYISSHFDPKHMIFSNIDGNLKKVHFDKDSIISHIDIKAKERSGLLVKKLQGRFKMSPVTIEVADLDLITNKSHIRNYFALQFKEFDDLRDFVTKVTMRAKFTDASISSDDIAFFAPPLKDWKKDIRISGDAYGPLDKLTGDDLRIQGGSSTLEGDVNLTGLPDINNTFLDLEAKELTTTGRDLQKFIPKLRHTGKIDLDSLRYLHFSGSYVGFIYDFVAYGHFKTNLGSLHSDLNLKFGPNHKVPVYSGKISSKGFDLGALLSLDKVGKIAFNTKINGSGFTLDHVNSMVDGHIDQVEVNGYDYHNIQLEGALKKKLFQGQVQIADSNLALNFQGDIDFNGKIPRFNFTSNIQKSDLRILQLTRDSITFSGKLKLNFAGNNLNNFLGEARLYDVHLFKNDVRIAFDTLVLHSQMDSSGKLLTMQGNEINGFIRGHYDIKKLPDVVQLFLSKYFPSRISPPDEKELKEDFYLSLHFGKIDSILHSFLPELKQLNNGQVTARVSTQKDSLLLDLNIADAGYNNYRFNDIQVQSRGTLKDLRTKNSIGEIHLKDSLILPTTAINTYSHQDSSLISIHTTGATALNKADIKARFITMKNGYKIKILNSALYVNNKDWHITPDNEILLEKDNITVHHFEISHNNQNITLTSQVNSSSSKDTSTNKNSFLVALNNLYISDFSQFFLPNVLLEGVANGKFIITDPLGEMAVNGTLDASQLRINNDSIGLIQAQASYDKETETAKWKLDKTDNPARNFLIKGLVGTGKNNNKLQGTFNLNHTDISLLGTFEPTLVSDFTARATGTLHLEGNRKTPELTGSVKLDSARMRIAYTQVWYTLNNETIQFTPGKIDLGSITLKDTHGRTGILSGDITHHHFQDLYFHLNLNTQGLQLLNTTVKDNAVYYGTAVGSGKVDFTGPASDMKMDISATPVSGTHIYLPLADEEDIGKHDFIIFKKYGKELKNKSKQQKKVNLTVKLNANMNPNAQIDVIVDAASGDHITARGNGALQINVDLKGDFHMYGNYSITKGNYVFSFKGLLSRNFAINQGSTISWNGDPSNANINITAIYHVPGGANLYNLLAGEAAATAGLDKEDQKLLRQREKIDVYLFLKNSLMHPDISYDIRIPEASISASSLALTKLQQIRQNPNMLINQVAALLAAGQFIPVNASNASSGILRSSGLSSAGQWVSSQLNGVLNNLFGSKLNELGVNFSMNYNAYSASGEYGDLQRNDVQFNLSKNLFNNRVQVEVGPSINWGRSNNPEASSSSYFAGDFRFEYLITPDGRVRFLAFSRSNYDVLLNENLTRAGIGISYSRQFDRLHELFRTKQEKKHLDSVRNARIQKYLDENKEDIDSLPNTPLPADTIKVHKKAALKEDEK